MLYRTVKITNFGGKLEYCIQLLPSERENTNTKPNPSGWFHYKETMSDKEAFEELKAVMLESHIEELEGLKSVIDSLQKLEFVD